MMKMKGPEMDFYRWLVYAIILLVTAIGSIAAPRLLWVFAIVLIIAVVDIAYIKYTKYTVR